MSELKQYECSNCGTVYGVESYIQNHDDVSQEICCPYCSSEDINLLDRDDDIFDIDALLQQREDELVD